MIDIATGVLTRALIISVFVFVMMLLIDYINVISKGKMRKIVSRKRRGQYITASFLGSTPGCLGAFMNVSLYVHGLLSFGAITAGMIATSGDEAFVMLTMFPRQAVLLFVLLFVLGIVGGWLADRIAHVFNIRPCQECELHEVHEKDKKHYFQPSVLRDFPKISPLRYLLILFFVGIIVLNISGMFGPQKWQQPEKIILISLSSIAILISATVSKHYLYDHVARHIIKEHIWKVFLWTFFALFFIEIGLQYWNLQGIIAGNIAWILVISAIVGIIPESGPHMVFVMMFSQGLIPFSVLLTSSIVQDGHGMLPLLSYTVKDSVFIKIFNFVFAVAIGLALLLLGW